MSGGVRLARYLPIAEHGLIGDLHTATLARRRSPAGVASRFGRQRDGTAARDVHEANRRPKLDRRRVIEDGKRERRKLISKWVAGG